MHALFLAPKCSISEVFFTLAPLFAQRNFACKKVIHLVDYTNKKVNYLTTFNERVLSFRDAVTAKNVPPVLQEVGIMWVGLY